MIYDMRYRDVESEHGFTRTLQVKRNASADWEDVRIESEIEPTGSIPMADEVRSLS